jgi:hypothetical protein
VSLETLVFAAAIQRWTFTRCEVFFVAALDLEFDSSLDLRYGHGDSLNDACENLEVTNLLLLAPSVSDKLRPTAFRLACENGTLL